jgi:hypothetical protein
MGDGLEESCVLYVHIWARTNDILILHLFLCDNDFSGGEGKEPRGYKECHHPATQQTFRVERTNEAAVSSGLT